MRREYYLHKRQNGIFYVEFISHENGKKLSARSTGEKGEIKARVKAELWKAQGIPTGRARKPRPIEEASGIEAVIRAMRRTGINPDDALRIVSTLKGMGLIDIAAVSNAGKGAVPFAEMVKKWRRYQAICRRAGVFKKYASHIEAKNIQDVGDAATEAFGKVLPFRKVV